MRRARPGLATIAVHGRPVARPPWTPIASPIVQSSTFTSPVGSTEEVLYTRYGNNPNQITIGERLADLEGGEAGLFVSSGMGATALAHLAVLRPGDHLIASSWIYGGTRRLFSEELTRIGIDVTFIDPNEPRAWKRAVRKTTRAIFIETPTNPLGRVVDVAPLATLARTGGFALLVDSTFATPVVFRPLEHGADIVIHSATKFLNGHTDVIAGAIVSAAPIVEEVRRRLQLWGQALDPMGAWLIERGMKTLPLRVARQGATALALARWLEEQHGVAKVHHPGLPSHPDHETAQRLLGGFSAIVGVELEGGAPAAERFLSRLRIAAHAPSLGGVETLVSEPRFTSHASLSPAERAKAGIPDGFVRVSVGVEDAEDLMADFAHALST